MLKAISTELLGSWRQDAMGLHPAKRMLTPLYSSCLPYLGAGATVSAGRERTPCASVQPPKQLYRRTNGLAFGFPPRWPVLFFCGRMAKSLHSQFALSWIAQYGRSVGWSIPFPTQSPSRQRAGAIRPIPAGPFSFGFSRGGLLGHPEWRTVPRLGVRSAPIGSLAAYETRSPDRRHAWTKRL